MKKSKAIRDQFYLTVYHGRSKFGISSNSNSGKFDNTVGVLYFNEQGYSGHTKRLEKLLKRELYDFLLKSDKDPLKALEYVDPHYTHITVPYMRGIVEGLIVEHKLKIRRLKEVYLPSVQMDKDLVNKVRENPDKYLEII
jgi:hypothetical protein